MGTPDLLAPLGPWEDLGSLDCLENRERLEMTVKLDQLDLPAGLESEVCLECLEFPDPKDTEDSLDWTAPKEHQVALGRKERMARLDLLGPLDQLDLLGFEEKEVGMDPLDPLG